MVFEEYFSALSRKYQDAFNWLDIRHNEDYFLRELNLELKESHPLYKRSTAALIKRESNDDVLFLLEDNICAIVHLTYSRCL